MPADAKSLGEKEFALIQEIARNPTGTQRRLSESAGLSLGMTNLLIKRLARKGLIKVTQLDWKRTRYLLTLKGAAEKSRKAYHYARYTWRLLRQIAENIHTVVRREYDEGRRDFWFVAQGEILELLQEEIEGMELPDARSRFFQDLAEVPAKADLILTALPEPALKGHGGRSTMQLVDFDNIDFRVS